jgi:hypothetical protein
MGGPLRWLILGLLMWATAGWAQTTPISGNRTITGWINFCTAGGTATAYTCTLAGIGSYRTGTRYTVLIPATNIGAATWNLNGLGPKTLKRVVGGISTDLLAGELCTGSIADLLYDGTNLLLLSSPCTTTRTIASGTLALATAAIASGVCATAQTATATGTLTTDVVTASFNGDITGVTGYTPATTGTLRVDIYPTANTVNARVCNATAASITPGAATLNWRVVR